MIQLKKIENFELFEAEFESATFVSLSFAAKFMAIYEAEGVDLATLNISKAFASSFWTITEITLEILNQLLVDLETETSIQGRFLKILGVYMNSAENFFSQNTNLGSLKGKDIDRSR